MTKNAIHPIWHFYLQVAVIGEKARVIAGFPTHAGIDNSGLAMEEEVQIRSRQDCERGLRGGEVEGNTRRGAWVLMAAKGASKGTDTVPDCAVNPDWPTEF